MIIDSNTHEQDPYQMPETTKLEIIDKIQALAYEIRMDWTDPRRECRMIRELCNKLKQMELDEQK
jgi:hypothetical protein